MGFYKKILNVFFLFYIIESFKLECHYVDKISLVQDIGNTEELLDALNSEKPTVIKLYSLHCPHCKMFEKPFEESAKKHKEIHFYSADGKKLNAPKIIAEFTEKYDKQIKIPGFPTILYIKDGKIQNHMIGGNPKKHTENLNKLK